MNIIVPIKQVPETSGVRMDEKTGTIVREGVESIVNPLDLYAVETALRLREKFGGRVTAVSMGPPSASRCVREALSMGCDDGVLVCGSEFAGSDTSATAAILAAACRKIGGFDLVVTGERATDGDTAQVGPELATFMDIPVVTYASRVIGADKGHLLVERLVEGGYETVSVQTPCLLTVLKEIAVPRLPRLSGKQKARRADIRVWGLGELPSLDPQRIGLGGSPTRVVKISTPKAARSCKIVKLSNPGDADRAADALIAFLKNRRLLPERSVSHE